MTWERKAKALKEEKIQCPACKRKFPLSEDTKKRLQARAVTTAHEVMADLFQILADTHRAKAKRPK